MPPDAAHLAFTWAQAGATKSHSLRLKRAAEGSRAEGPVQLKQWTGKRIMRNVTRIADGPTTKETE